ncbi:MAG: hypothetical protein ACTSU2_01385 [Promethearchaeota archaeon]
MNEKVIYIENERDQEKIDEMISSYVFDAIYAVEQENTKLVILRSRGYAINICAAVANELRARFNHAMTPFRMKIYLNSKFLNDKNSNQGRDRRYNSRRPRRPNIKELQNFDFKHPKIVSFMDVKFFINSK